MKATLTVEQDEIVQAVREWVERSGWSVSDARIRFVAGDSGDPRDRGPACKVELVVEPARRPGPLRSTP